MNIFKSFNNELTYNDILQLDGCFATAHINYNQSPIFNGIDGKEIALESRKNSLSAKDRIEDVLKNLRTFDGTEENFKKEDQIVLWKSYWLEYINAFDKLMISSPNSIVTVFIGRHAIEIGIKYLLFIKTGKIVKQHDLDKLCASLFNEYNIQDDYMNDIPLFCNFYSQFIEGGNVEYFRFPEYNGGKFFAGNRLDIKWLSYNFSLVILKLIHFADLEDFFLKE